MRRRKALALVGLLGSVLIAALVGCAYVIWRAPEMAALLGFGATCAAATTCMSLRHFGWLFAIVDTAAGLPRGRFTTDMVTHFATTSAAPNTTWRLGWDTPSSTPGVSHAGDLWPRTGSIGHLGFTGTSLWLDLPNRRWVALLTNRVHPSRFGSSAEDIKALRRAVNDRAMELF